MSQLKKGEDQKRNNKVVGAVKLRKKSFGEITPKIKFMKKEIEETQTPKLEPEKTGENLEEEAPEAEEGEKTPDAEMQKEINSLYASKKWEQQKRREAEERALKAEEELLKLKEKLSSTPSEEELSKEYPDWEYYDEATREMYRKITKVEKELLDLRMEKIKEEEKEKWEKKFSEIVNENPILKANKEEFRELVNQEKYKDIPLSVLSELFLSKKEKKKEEKETFRSGLEKATGGEKVIKRSSGTMTLEEVSELRRKNPQLYFKLIKERRIKIED